MSGSGCDRDKLYRSIGFGKRRNRCYGAGVEKAVSGRVLPDDEALVGRGGYRKGAEARSRILAAAMRAFGEAGYRGATTRRIAEEAEVSLPALKYYFGGKEGLYLACAQEILERYQARMLPLVLDTVNDMASGQMTAQGARDRLGEVLIGLTDLQARAREAEAWTVFVLREMAEQGPAFDLLYGQLWAPGVELTATLIARIRGRDSPSGEDRLEAVLLLSSLSTFSTARPVTLRILGWEDVDGERLAQVRRAVQDQIDRIR